MAIEDTPQATLRDEISAQFDALVPEDTPTQAPAAPAAEPSAPAGETAEQRAGRTAGRPRDEKGRLLPGKAAKEAEPQAQPSATPPVGEVPQAPAVPAAPKVARPSSWRKDHWEAFDKLATENPALAQYINQREQEFSRGVSTYKTEWESAKPLLDAVAPFMQVMQQHNVQPAQMVHNLMSAHHTLALGDPQTKAQFVQRMLVDYGINAQLAVQNQAGEWQLLAAPPQRQPQQQQPQQQDVRKTVQEILLEERAAQQIQEFTGNTEKHPHYEVVRETMTGLLHAGLANTLEEAYEAALRHPRHADLYEAQAQQQRDADEKQRREAEQQRAEQARRKAISPRTASPSSGAAPKADAKDLRREIEANFDALTSGRV